LVSGKGPGWESFLEILAPTNTDRILDLGAGDCKNALLVLEASKGAEICAIDPNEKKIAAARRDRPSVKSSVGSAEDIPFPDSHFDKVYSTLALHHFADLGRALREIARVLRPGGSFVVLELEPDSFNGWFFRFFGKLMGEKLTFIEQEALVATLERDANFHAVRSVRIGGEYLVQFLRT
jgi:ubiquinone/menaquinone biosynthesis C-methylase UbiE